MSKLFDFILFKIQTFNPADPLQALDLFLAIGLIIAFLIYLSRFPVFRVVLGILLLLALTSLTIGFGFIFTGVVIGFGTGLVLVALPLIFAPEIRHYLDKLGRFPFLHIPAVLDKQKKEVFIRSLVGAVYELAERETGALIIIQRNTSLGHVIDSGVVLDAKFGSKLLASIFHPGNVLHDGAVILKGERIIAARSTVPVLDEVQLDPPLGQRHKAGLSITIETDAISLIVSEQRGNVALAENGKLELNIDRATLSTRLSKLI